MTPPPCSIIRRLAPFRRDRKRLGMAQGQAPITGPALVAGAAGSADAAARHAFPSRGYPVVGLNSANVSCPPARKGARPSRLMAWPGVASCARDAAYHDRPRAASRAAGLIAPFAAEAFARCSVENLSAYGALLPDRRKSAA